MKKNMRRNFDNHCRENTFKDATHHLVQLIRCAQTVHWWHNCSAVGTAEVLVLFKAAHESYTQTTVGCVLETVFSIKVEARQTLQWVWHQKDSSATNPKLVLIRSLHTQTLQKGKTFWWWWWLGWWRLLRQCFLTSLILFLILYLSALSASPLPGMTRRQSNYKQESKQRNSLYRSLGFIALGKCVYLV